MSAPIKVSELIEAQKKWETEKEKSPEDTIKLLKKYGVLRDNGSLSSKSVAYLSGLSKEKRVILTDEGLVEFKSTEGTNVQGEKPSFQLTSSSNTKITNVEAIKQKMEQETFQIDQLKLKEQIENFIKTVTLDDESYTEGEIIIKHFGDPDAELNMLITAGTKILDGLVYVSMKGDTKSINLFKMEQVDGICDSDIIKNIRIAKRAIQAAFVLVFTQGSLPGKADDKRKVPEFVKSKLYDGDTSLSQISEELSHAPTKKFPAKVFLKIDIDNLPSAVCSRCKLNIAGNRSVRYAGFASSFQTKQKLTPDAGATPEAMMQLLETNQKIEKSIAIRDFLKTMEGQWKNQKRLHPLADEKPTIKNFTLKLTCAIIYSLTPDGRIDMAERILSDNNKGFQNDRNFFGDGEGPTRTWNVLTKPEADFSNITVDGLKGIFGVTTTM
uniref:CP protein n=1 Tax=Citrus psorosis virus TaxID=73561 RepID=A0A4Y5QWA0_9VIRU|nr:CP protein [Citrus psorosis virus]